MFTDNADLRGFFVDNEELYVHEVHHSSSIRIDEGQAEMASGTGKILFESKFFLNLNLGILALPFP